MRAILAFALSVVVAVLATRTWRALSSDRAQLVHALNLLDEMEQRLEMAEEVGRRASRTTVEASNTMRGQRDLIREELEAYRREVQFELGGMQQMLDNRTKEAESLKKEVEYQASLTKKQCAGYVKKAEAQLQQVRAELQASEKRTLAAKASLQVADARVAQWREELSERLRCLRAAELAHNRSFFPMPLGASAPESELQLVPWREGLGVFLWAGCVSRARLDSIMVGGATVALYEETSTVAESLRTSGKCLDHWDMQRLLVLEGSPSATLEQRLRAWHPFEASGARVWMMRIGCSSAVVGLKAAWMLLEDEHAHPLVLQVDGTISSATWDKLRHWQYRLYRCGTGEEGSTGTNCIFYKSRADHSVVLPPADAERRSAYANQLAQEVLNYFGTRTAAEKDGNTPHVVGAFDAARKQLFASAMSVLGKSQQ